MKEYAGNNKTKRFNSHPVNFFTSYHHYQFNGCSNYVFFTKTINENSLTKFHFPDKTFAGKRFQKNLFFYFELTFSFNVFFPDFLIWWHVLWKFEDK